jgi:hypothetical protein
VSTNPSAAATSTASSNQFNTTAPNTVTVNPPVCPTSNFNCAVQVTLTNQQNTLFGRVFLPSTVNIVTTATATYQILTDSNGTPIGQTCLLGLGTYGSNPPSGQVIRINGATRVYDAQLHPGLNFDRCRPEFQ